MIGPSNMKINIVKHSKTMMSNQLTTSAASLAVNFFQNFLNISRNFILLPSVRPGAHVLNATAFVGSKHDSPIIEVIPASSYTQKYDPFYGLNAHIHHRQSPCTICGVSAQHVGVNQVVYGHDNHNEKPVDYPEKDNFHSLNRFNASRVPFSYPNP